MSEFKKKISFSVNLLKYNLVSLQNKLLPSISIQATLHTLKLGFESLFKPFCAVFSMPSKLLPPGKVRVWCHSETSIDRNAFFFFFDLYELLILSFYVHECCFCRKGKSSERSAIHLQTRGALYEIDYPHRTPLHESSKMSLKLNAHCGMNYWCG